ncbi:MAG: hypothetical protein ACE5FI_16225, partial [Anaerolineales bacterium]
MADLKIDLRGLQDLGGPCLRQSPPRNSGGEGDDDYLWTAAFLDERFAQPVSPLGWSLVAEPFERIALREPLELLGAAIEDGPLVKLWYGRPYSRVEIWQRIYKLFPEWLLPDDAARFFPGGDVSLRAQPLCPTFGLHLIWNGITMLGRDPGAASPLHNPRAWSRFERALQAALPQWEARLRALVGATDSVRGRLALLRESVQFTDRLLVFHRWSLLYADLLYTALRQAALLRLGSAEGERVLVGLAAGFDSVTGRVNAEMARLADHIRDDGRLCESLAQAAVIDELPPGEFKRQLARFLERYGHRFFSLDIYDPPWAGDLPAFAKLLLAVARRDPAPTAPQSGVGNAPAAVRLLASATRPYVRLREAQRFRWQQIMAFQRRVLLQLGDLWVASRDLQRSTDVFGLTWPEIASLQLDAQAAAARVALLESRRAAPRNYPAFLKGAAPMPEPIFSGGGQELVGRSVSAGIARGPARVVT